MKQISREHLKSQDWYFVSILLLIGLFSILLYYGDIAVNLGLASLIVLFIMLFFSFEEIMPNARESRKRKAELRRKYRK